MCWVAWVRGAGAVCEYKTDKRHWRSVETVSRAAACEINMISKASMFIYWKYLDRMQTGLQLLPQGEDEGHLACPFAGYQALLAESADPC